MLVHSLHYQRAFKTPYELVAHAPGPAPRGARPSRRRSGVPRPAARKRRSTRPTSPPPATRDFDLPYNNIIALNENGATLHYQYKDAATPREHRSLLIDAGAEVDGYAVGHHPHLGQRRRPTSQALVDAVEHEQLALCALVRAGTDYRDLHLECHLRLGAVLRDLGIVDMDPGQMLANGVTSAFFPHGLGHPIGLQVHDVAGFSDEHGTLIPRPDGHPFLRMTRTLAPGMVVTIEPGLYFIPTLLAKLRDGPHGEIGGLEEGRAPGDVRRRAHRGRGALHRGCAGKPHPRCVRGVAAPARAVRGAQ